MKRITAALFLLLALGGWTLYPPGHFVEPVVQVEGSGGLCPSGDGAGRVCNYAITTIFDGGKCIGACKRAQIAESEIAALKAAIAGADFADLRAKKPGICPSAHDGEDIIYVFHTMKGEERLNSCEYSLDMQKEPFKALQTILGEKRT